MVIKSKRSCCISIGIILLVGVMVFRLSGITPTSIAREHPYTSATTIVDKVYTFQAPEDELYFESMLLKEDYMYYIFIEIVTPHSCGLNITLWDPQNRRYDIFSSNLTFETQGYERAEIPFGTALGGNYSFLFSMVLQFNLNLYIRIEEGDLCLRDKIPVGDWNKMIFYRVTKFDNGTYIEHNIQFKTDTSYKFYFGRVSPIASEENNVYISNNITDPNNIVFKIYFNSTLVPINEIQDYSFGTSVEGLYIIQLQIRSDVEYINLAYGIVEDYVISELDDNNQTGTPSNSTGYERGIFSIPFEVITVLSVIIISIIVILGVFIYYRNQKRSSAINLYHF